MSSVNALSISFLVLLLFTFSVQSATASNPTSSKGRQKQNSKKLGYTLQDDCNRMYTVSVKTGSIPMAGTDSLISLTLYDCCGGVVHVQDLEAWGGSMEARRNYFERHNLDIFSGRGPCLASPVCAVKVTSDGSRPNHGWYCKYVEVATTRPNLPDDQQKFTVEQWLARDRHPHELSASRDYCASSCDRVSKFTENCPNNKGGGDTCPKLEFNSTFLFSPTTRAITRV